MEKKAAGSERVQMLRQQVALAFARELRGDTDAMPGTTRELLEDLEPAEDEVD